MLTISRDSPCLSTTAVANQRLPIFRTDAVAAILCGALDEARTSGGFLVFAYVIMPDHIHIRTDEARKPSDTLRFIKGISARRIIQYLKDRGFQTSLEKLRGAKKADHREYALWQPASNVVLITAETVFMQRVHYIHQNPVRAGLVERAEDYRWSSVRFWNRFETDDEPMRVDLDKIAWRVPK